MTVALDVTISVQAKTFNLLIKLCRTLAGPKIMLLSKSHAEQKQEPFQVFHIGERYLSNLIFSSKNL